MMDDQRYKEVILAALLHDIGKFYGRSATIKNDLREYGRDIDLSTPHPALSGLFISKLAAQIEEVGLDARAVKTLVEHHHEHHGFDKEFRVDGVDDPELRVLALLVSRADNYSSKEREEIEQEGFHSYFSSPLDSVFCRINLSGEDREIDLMQQKPAALSEAFLSGSPFPEKIHSLDKLKLERLVADFGQQVAALKAKDFNTLYIRLHDLLHKYCWAIPADVREKIKDVSLFDHLKTTSAIAACLYQYHSDLNGLINEQAIKSEQVNKFLLIGGDISGIQQYIYDISGIGAGAVAKKLRARSFKVSMMMEAASLLIINELGLPYSSILYCSGGRFYILAANTDSAKDNLAQIKSAIEEWMFKEFAGNLALNLAYVDFNASGFEDFGSVLKRLGNELEIAKRNKFSTQLRSVENHVLSYVFQEDGKQFLRKKSGEPEICRSCQKFPATLVEEQDGEERPSCKSCHDDRRLGEILPKARFISFALGSQNHVNTNKGIGEHNFNFFGHVDVKISSKSILEPTYIVYNINSDLESLPAAQLKDKPVVDRFIANYVPKDSNGEIWTFEEIADKAEGAKHLGILKADVDRLGLIFSAGLKGRSASISRLSGLSRMLDLFFTAYLPRVIKEEFESVYVVYSGGDDLLLICPWDKLFNLSRRLYDDFRRYTASNPDITLSAGLALSTKKTPVWHMADMAEQELERSKKKGRDRLSIFNTAVEWDKYSDIEDIGNTLCKAMKAKEVSSSFIYSLLQFCTHNGLAHNRHKNDALNRARLTYQIARHLEEKDAESLARKETRDLLKQLTQSVHSNRWNYMVVPISYALLKNRD
ncbi:MAG: type III-A CRISPR-associated protein Cas10/Csm1 [Paenibacillus sp.]|nr:type III-A CRISPR-associated protein Cas10/Csm1 [Paenibacillus sp.]